MGFFDIFRKKSEGKPNKRNSRAFKLRQHVRKLGFSVEGLQAQLKTVHIALDKHDQQLSEHSELIAANSKGLNKLEQIVEESKINAPTEATSPPIRPVVPLTPIRSAEPTEAGTSKRFDIGCFSEQEKRILAVFFNNKDMALSYADIASALNKSHHTVKNQMNQMRLKADLFNCALGNESRKRFKLKDDLKIEKYLNVG